MNADSSGRIARLRRQIEAELSPQHLEIHDESHRHAGHQESFDGTGETHLRVLITAPVFEGMSRVERHRTVNAIAAAEIASGLHALAIEARAPSEVSG